jgi:hypothetical protein
MAVFYCVAQFNQVRTVTNEYEDKKGNNLNAGTKNKSVKRAANQEARSRGQKTD